MTSSTTGHHYESTWPEAWANSASSTIREMMLTSVVSPPTAIHCSSSASAPTGQIKTPREPGTLSALALEGCLTLWTRPTALPRSSVHKYEYWYRLH